MPRPCKVLGNAVGVRECSRRGCAVRRGDSRRGSLPQVDGGCERRGHGLVVLLRRHHERQSQPIALVGAHRDARQSAGVVNKECHLLGCAQLCCHDEVPFVLPVLVVEHDDEPSIGDFGDALLDGVKPFGGFVEVPRLAESRRLLFS